jgi:hypothetical protein
MSEQKLNVVLYDNPLTPDPSDKVAKVQSNGTLYNSDIAREIVEERSEYRYETILNVLNLSDSVKRKNIAGGFHVIDGVVWLSAGVTGPFSGIGAQYDPEVNAVVLHSSASAEMRKELQNAKVNVSGTALVGPLISRVEDVYSGETNTKFTHGRNLRIYGRHLRIAGTDPSVGVYFVKADDPTTRLAVYPRDIIQNNPSELIVVSPAEAVVDEEYFLEVTTQFSTTADKTVKDPRTYRFEHLLVAE